MENENLIAIVGASGRFPKADTIDELWKNLLEKKECIRQFTKEELIRAGLDRE